MPLQYFWDYILLCSFFFPQGSYLSFCCFSYRFPPSRFLTVVMVEGKIVTLSKIRPLGCEFPSLGPPVLSLLCCPVREFHFLGFCSLRKACAGSFSNSQTKILTTVWSVWIVSAYCLSLVPVHHISVLCIYKEEHARKN